MNQELIPFQTFGFQHFIVLTFFLGAGWVLVRWAKTQPPERQVIVGQWLGWSVFLSLFGTNGVRWVLGDFDKHLDIPLHLCHVSALLLPILMTNRPQWLFNILYFWVFAGTLPAILTPDLKGYGFPHWIFFRYWYLHCALVLSIVYCIVVYGMRPSWKALLQSFAVLQVYGAFVGFVNWHLGTNYIYLCRKPASATPLDLFGTHPWYVLAADGIAILAFVLVLAPYWKRKTA